MEESLVDRLDTAFEPFSFKIDGHDVVHVRIDQRSALGMDVTEDEHTIGPGNSRAHVTFR